MKQALSFLGAILAVIAFAFWNGSLESRVTNLETTSKKIDRIYWYLIDRNNIELPKELR